MGKASRPTHRKAGYSGKKTVPTWSTTIHTMAISLRKLVSRFVLSLGVCVCVSMVCAPLYGCSPPQPPRGLAPPGVGRKTKTPCRAKPTQREKRKASSCDTNTEHTNKTALYKKAGLSYHIPCGAAFRPLCRCVITCIGFQVLAHLETAAFLFFMSMISRLGFACKSFSKFARRGSRAVPPSS